MKEKKLNNTVCKFTYQKDKYEVDRLEDSLWGNDMYVFHVFSNDKYVCEFEGSKFCDYKKLAIEEIDSL